LGQIDLVSRGPNLLIVSQFQLLVARAVMMRLSRILSTKSKRASSMSKDGVKP